MVGIGEAAVAAVFEGYPPAVRRRALALRALIFETAVAEGVGEIEETLKWGEPAYLTSRSKAGTTIRFAWKEAAPREYGVCFHCQTDLIERFRRRFADELVFDGNRRIVLHVDDEPPVEALRECVADALTYHRRKRLRRG
ncbi:MAG: DUF1801 domain-containing protein [Myxococcota bacterium]